jgi:hypothetical protein
MSGAESSRRRALAAPGRLARGAHDLASGASDERLSAALAVGRGEGQPAEPRDVTARVVEELPERAVLDLSHPFAGDAHVRADLLEGHASWVLQHGLLRGNVRVPLEVSPRVGDVGGSSPAALLRRSDGSHDRQRATYSQPWAERSSHWCGRNDDLRGNADSQARRGNGYRSSAVRKLRSSDSVPHGNVLPLDPVWVLGAANNHLLIFVFEEASRVREGTRTT